MVNKNRSRNWSALALAFAFSLTLACSEQEAKESAQKSDAKSRIESIKESGNLRIGVFGDKPPFGYIDAEGNNQGFDIEIAKAVTQSLLGDADKAEFVLVEAANRVEYLQSNKVDIIFANFTVTPARQEVVDFADPYMKVALGIVSREDNPISSVEDLDGKTLLLNKGTTADAYFTRNHPEIKTLKFEQNTETFEALRDGRGDALAHDNTMLFAWAEENPGFVVAVRHLGEQDFIAPAVKKGDTELRDYLNETLRTLSDEGVLKEAYEKTLLPVYGDDVLESDILIDYEK